MAKVPILIVALLCLPLDLFALTFVWPVPNPNQGCYQQPSVAKTYGDWERYTDTQMRFFHPGIDIPHQCYSAGHSCAVVVAMDTCKVFRVKNYGLSGRVVLTKEIRTAHPRFWLYGHLCDVIIPADSIYYEGDTIGKIWHDFRGYDCGYADHLHLEFVDTTRYLPDTTLRWPAIDNPLRHMEGPSNYTDPGNVAPSIWEPGNPYAKRVGFRVQPDMFWPQGQVKWAYPQWAADSTPMIHGNVDIIANARDSMLGRLNTCVPVKAGVYKLGFWVTGPTGLGSEDKPVVCDSFQGILPDSTLFYHYYSTYHDSCDTNYYIVTNIEGATDSCWATRAKYNQSGLSAGGDTAITPDSARFPDDTFYVYVRAWDALNHPSPAIPAKVVLENYYPIATSVYPAEGACVTPVTAETIRVFFSERMGLTQLQMSRVELYDEMHDTTYTAGFRRLEAGARCAVYADTQSITPGLYQATLKGAPEDLFGHQLDTDKDGKPGLPFYHWHFSVATGEIYAADPFGDVRIYQDDGELLWAFMNPDADTSATYSRGSPIALAEDDVGRIFVYVATHCDYGSETRDQIRKYTADGTLVAQSNTFDYELLHLATDNRDIYATEDIPNAFNKVRIFDLDLNLEYTWSPECVEPKGIAYSQLTDRVYMDGGYLVIDTTKVPPETTYEYVLASYDARYLTLTDTIGLSGAYQCLDHPPNPIAVDNQYVYAGVCSSDVYRIFVYDLGLNQKRWSIPANYPNDNFAIFGNNMWIGGGVSGLIDWLNVIDKHSGQIVDTILDYRFDGVQVATFPPSGGGGFFAGLRPKAPPALPHIQTAEAKRPVPRAFALSQNNPNPFYGDTRISYAIPKRSHVVLRIYDVAGRLVSTLVDEEEDAGFFDVVWRGDDGLGRQMPNGVYLCDLIAGRFAATKKLVLVR